MSELARVPTAEIQKSHIDTEALMRLALDKGPEAVAALEKLVALHEHQQDREAKQSFAEAFARARSKLRTINARHANPDRSGNVRWWMASINDLLDAVEPVLREENLELDFDVPRLAANPNIVDAICRITHVPTGFSKEWHCGYNAGNAQGGDLGAATSAKRGALLAALALKVEHDEDARMLGDLINLEQATNLRTRLRATGRNEKKFLAFALGCDESLITSVDDAWKQIRQGKLSQLHDFLRQAELKKQTGGAGRDAGATTPITNAPPA